MRWKKAEIGDLRTDTFFALLPVTCIESNEVRWLEWVTVVSQRIKIGDEYWWQRIKFIESEVKS